MVGANEMAQSRAVMFYGITALLYQFHVTSSEGYGDYNEALLVETSYFQLLCANGKCGAQQHIAVQMDTGPCEI